MICVIVWIEHPMKMPVRIVEASDCERVRSASHLYFSRERTHRHRLALRLAAPMIWANWRGLESLLKAQLKLKKCNMVPAGRIEDGINCSVPIATPNFHPMVADGRIKAIRGTFDHYEAGTIVMSGGERVEADLAVLAIGYKLGVPFLPEAWRAKLVDADGQ